MQAGVGGPHQIAEGCDSYDIETINGKSQRSCVDETSKSNCLRSRWRWSLDSECGEEQHGGVESRRTKPELAITQD